MTERTELDRTLGFAILEQHARGRLVRLGPVLDEILSAHAYPPVVEKLLAEALALTALLGATLKDESGQMTLQAQTESGPIDLLVCDYKDGQVRGYVQFDADRIAMVPSDPSLFALFGKGYLAITFDQAVSGERYQGIVPLEGASLAEAAQSYFSQSEQIPSLVQLAHRHDVDGRCIAGGILLQHLPEGEEGRDRLHTRLDHPEWQHVEALGRTIKDDELTDPDLPMETLVWRLFHDEKEVRVLGGASLSRGCRCNREHILGVLSRLPQPEQADMADEHGLIRVDCAFCSISHPIALSELATVE
ncbi:Hsp33 family molecular chaperone HslO [Sphingomonas sp. ID1715]|uniref:Hsp33 family molecular chaperone HslO n=1 Tax=Sphingomonas sp. ID1715 TaxID=1656898 RepID=UPI001487D1C6|nr:Hsp33 family molecular chaperone HslO [Sphingomonas sp. ID1715]NNM75860.1 Hsp33 family molecular chaperone HslO [Sphingomonas sp. ID1715]